MEVNMNWVIRDTEFDKGKIEQNGSKFILGNGYMGYRGTMEEYSKDQLVACNLTGIYDKVGDAWREPVNAPDGFFTKVFCGSELLGTLSDNLKNHEQCLDFRKALHSRDSVFSIGGNEIRLKSERFLSLEDVHLMCLRYSITCSEACELTLETGLNGDIWDINGPHLEDFETGMSGNTIHIRAYTHQSRDIVATAETAEISFGTPEIDYDKNSVMRKLVFRAEARKEYSFSKYVSVCTGKDTDADPLTVVLESCERAAASGYDRLAAGNAAMWLMRWEDSDVIIDGDEDAQHALRYSIYQLLAIAPMHSDRVSIPARGLSGQMYKGAIFWDTEMFMLPFFIHTNPCIARNLLKYRCNTLDGARRKAAEYGFRGAFYAWESQDTGDDACTLFCVTDVIILRPVRTYFRDKQIHISADVAYAMWNYVRHTGDVSLLYEGGAEVILECARFFYSYAYYNMDKDRYELLDVTGPDEYHERVNNNAFTNRLVRQVLDIALEVLELLEKENAVFYRNLISKLDFSRDIENIRKLAAHLYIPEPQPENLVIQQFDGYDRLEDVGLEELKNRKFNKNEYLGGGSGPATTTKIIKQADVVLMLNHFKDCYPHSVKRANWEYYEPRTEHGSSLSPCVYAMLAADIGNTEWSYEYFMKTATIDLTGEAKQYVGTLYIGGTHPAANGGAWMSAVLGFGGLTAGDGKVVLQPRLPLKWRSMKFRFFHIGQRYEVNIDKNFAAIDASPENTRALRFVINGTETLCGPGQSIKAGI